MHVNKIFAVLYGCNLSFEHTHLSGESDRARTGEKKKEKKIHYFDI